MHILTLDFETYYDRDLGFAKQTTEEYIRDPRFEVVGVAVQVDDGEPEWVSGTKIEISEFLSRYNWADCYALAHNAIFDGAILNWHFDIRPKAWLDTLSMARPVHGVDAGGSLTVLAERYGLGEKGTKVVAAMGKMRALFTKDDLAAYGEYCKNDVQLVDQRFARAGGHDHQGVLSIQQVLNRLNLPRTKALEAEIRAQAGSKIICHVDTCHAIRLEQELNYLEFPPITQFG